MIVAAVTAWVDAACRIRDRPHAAARARLLDLRGPRTRVFPDGHPRPVDVSFDARLWRAACGTDSLPPALHTSRLVVQPAGTWIQLPDAQRLDDRRKQASMRIVACLAYWEVRDPGRAVSPERLIAAAWPDEKLVARAGRNRLYVAVHAARAWPLGARIDRAADGGYRLLPDVALDLG
jgi:hypothetical protein